MTGDLGAAAANALAGHRRRTRTRLVILCLLAAATLGAFLLDIVTGPSSLSAGDAIRGILAPGGLSRSATVIIWDVRLPQALDGGARRRRAVARRRRDADHPQQPAGEPVHARHVLGRDVRRGARDRARHRHARRAANWIVSANAFVVRASARPCCCRLLARLRGSGGETLVLFGIALFFTFNALVAIMQFIASEQALQQLVFWTMGSLTRANSGQDRDSRWS